MDSTLQTVLVVAFAAAGGAWMLTVAATAFVVGRTRAAGDHDAIVARADRAARITRYVALPAAVLAAGAGAWYVLGRDQSIDANWWIGTAAGAWLVCFFGSTFTRAPQLARAVRLAGEHGAGDEDVQWRIRSADLTSRGELLLLVVAAIVLVLQPT